MMSGNKSPGVVLLQRIELRFHSIFPFLTFIAVTGYFIRQKMVRNDCCKCFRSLPPLRYWSSHSSWSGSRGSLFCLAIIMSFQCILFWVLSIMIQIPVVLRVCWWRWIMSMCTIFPSLMFRAGFALCRRRCFLQLLRTCAIVIPIIFPFEV